MNFLTLRYDEDKKQLLEEISLLKKQKQNLLAELNSLKQTSNHLIESEKKFEQLFQNISDAVYYLKIDDDGIASNFIEVNKKAYNRLGYTRDEMLNMSPFDIDYHEREELIGILKLIKDNETMTFETFHICKDGTLLPVEVKTHILMINGEIYTLSACRDITERKRAEDLKIQAEKMNVVAQLAAGIAHEIRNPLTTLKGFVQLFRSNTVPTKEVLDVMEDELERINTISGEFLTLAKPYGNDFSPIDLQELLKNTVEFLFNDASRKSISILTKFAKEKIIVHGVGLELKKVFLNLLKNAMEAMPNGGDITIMVENKDGVVEILIQDHGVGMTDEQIDRLGEPFFTTKETGTGLGLVVTFNIIQTHNGEISVNSRMNEGTTFAVKLPIAKNSDDRLG